MNKSYEVINNEVIVYDEYYSESTREYTNNIEEILITENNIEEIDELIENEEDNKDRRDSFEIIIPSWLGFGTAQLISCIYRLFTNDIGSAISHFIASIGFLSLAYFGGIKKLIKRKEIAKKKISFLEEKRDEESEKLYELNKDKTNDVMFVDENLRELPTNRTVYFALKDRLRDINLYMVHKQKFIKLYKKGLLVNELYEACASHDTIDFIMELVKNDLSIENKSKKNKVKIKANDTKYGNI